VSSAEQRMAMYLWTNHYSWWDELWSQIL